MAGRRSERHPARSGGWRPSTAAATLRGQHAAGELRGRRGHDSTRVVASWQRGAVHIWGWDGSDSAPPFWLYSAGREPGWPGPPTQAGFLSSLDVQTPAGERLRPMSARLDPISGGEWLRRVTADNDSVLWFAAIATLAERTVQAQLITPQLRVLPTDDDADVDTPADTETRAAIGAGPRGSDARNRSASTRLSGHTGADGRLATVELLAEWCPVHDEETAAALDALAAAMAPICVPLIDHGDDAARAAATTEIFAAFVDGAARRRLIDRGWRPPARGRRGAERTAARQVFEALAREHGRLLAEPGPTLDALLTLAARFERLANRRHGLPSVVGRLRLHVPDDRLDPWTVALELVDESDPGRWCSAADVLEATPLALDLAGGAAGDAAGRPADDDRDRAGGDPDGDAGRDTHGEAGDDVHGDALDDGDATAALPTLRAELGRLAQLVSHASASLAAFGETPFPTAVELDVDEAADVLEHVPAFLERFGISVIGPEHLVRADIAVRGRARETTPNDRVAGFNRDTIVQWTLTVAEDGGEPSAISDAELERAEELGSTLIHTGNRWVRIDPAALRAARRRQLDYATLLDGGDTTGGGAAAGSPGAAALALVHLAGEAAAAGDDLGVDLDVDLDAATGADLDGAVVDADHARASAAWAGLLLGGLPDDQLTEAVESEGFRGELRHYQRRGLSWLRFLHRLGLGGCLADDMGLGKTATALAHLLDLPGPHLVVCPLSVVHNWETETRRFTPRFRVTVHHGATRRARHGDATPPRGLFDDVEDDVDVEDDDGQSAGLDDEAGDALPPEAQSAPEAWNAPRGVRRTSDGPRPDIGGAYGPDDLVVTTYGVLTRDLDHLAATEWSVVVLDEAQFVKNPATKAAKAARRLRSSQRVALSGTPVENRLGELWALLDWANPGMLGSRESFRHRYSKPIERGDDSPAANEAAQRLRAITKPFVLRRTKSDRTLLPDLPDKIEQIAYAGLTREQGVLYQKVVDELLAEADQHEGMKRRALVLGAITRLKQICNHPAQALGDDSRIAGRSGKLARFDELIDNIVDNDDRALVFTQFVAMGNLLQRHLAARHGWQVPFLEGSVSKRRRDEMVARFQAGSGPPVLLISLRAGGTGLNLTAASQVIHYDRWWNPAVEDQATDRAWRIGQHSTVLVHKLVCEGTVEERIDALINDKKALADAVVGQGETWLSELSTAELRQLVTLTTPSTGRRDHDDGSKR